MQVPPTGETHDSGTNSPATPPPERLREALERVLESPSFIRSPRLSRFLRFIVESTLEGEDEKLKEYTIGVEVFDRGESFDPRVETIVRVEARRLRNQLSEYYGDAGQEDEVRFEIPKGAYRPVFRAHTRVDVAPAARALDPKTIVVLPFDDMSPQKDHAYFCDGITEEITHALTQVGWLRVISRTSAFAFKAATIDVREIGKKLGAGTALEGSVRTSEKRVRVTAQLIDASEGQHLWSQKFERELSDVFEIQDSVTKAVVEHLEASLGGIGEKPPQTQKPSRGRAISIDAYNLYLKGRYYAYRYTRESVASAIECFEKSIAEDSHYAQPWAGLAEAHAITAILGWAPSVDVMPRAKSAARRALEIDEGVAEAHASLALVLFRHDYEWEEAEKEYQRAMELSPGSGTIWFWYSSFLVFRQRPEAAILEARRASELDPQSVEAQRVVADTLYFCRRFEETIELCRTILSHHPDYYFAHFYKGLALAAQDKLDEAVRTLETTNRLASSLPLTRAVLGWALGRAGETKRARELLRELLEEREGGYFPALFIAMVYVGLGELDRALEWLEKAFAQRDSLLPVLEVDQMWDPVHSDPRCTDLLERMGLG